MKTWKSDLLTSRLLKKVLFVRRAFDSGDGFRHLTLVTLAAAPVKTQRSPVAKQPSQAIGTVRHEFRRRSPRLRPPPRGSRMAGRSQDVRMTQHHPSASD